MFKKTHSRRNFLKLLSLGAAVSFINPPPKLFSVTRSPKIADIEIFPVNYPMKGRFKFFEGPEGHMIGRAAAIVKITAENGTVGWGESVPIPKWSYETLETVTTTIRNYFRPVLIGHKIFDIHGALKIMNKNIAPSFNMGQPMAKAGVDIALHDLVGKLTNQTIAQTWNRGSTNQVTLSWTLNPKKITDVESLIEQGWNLGYRNFNVKVAPNPKFDLELCRLVMKHVPDGFLWADANGGYDLATAKAIAPKLADIGVAVLEQPLRINNLAGYRELKAQGALPILMGEGVVSPSSLIEFIRLDLLDGVAMKPARCGGLVTAKRQIEILLDAGLMFLGSGLTDPDISLAATLALYGAFDYTFPAALNGPQFINQSVLKNPFIQKNGKLKIPTNAGLGIEVDEKKIQEILVKI